MKSTARHDIEISERAADLHKRALVADLHVDSGSVHATVGYDITKRHKPFPYSPMVWQADIPRIIEGGLDCVGFGVVVNPLFPGAMRRRSAIKQIEYFNEVERTSDKLIVARNVDDVLRAKEQGKIAGVLGLEGCHGLYRGIEDVETYHAKGLRYLTLAHFSRNNAATPAFGWGADKKSGLTTLGRAIVKACDRVGMLIDLAHINKPGFMEAAELAEGPVFVSHTAVAGVLPHWRNVDDEMIAAVKEHEGCVGVIFGCHFLTKHISCDLQAVVDHISYMADKFGTDVPAIGSDIDGLLWTLPRGMKDISRMPALTELLCRRGFNDDEITAIIGGNFVRTFGKLKR